MKIIIAVLLVACLFASAQAQTGQNWAVLVAGSNGYYNYRHQSDVFHAFQVLKSNGIPASNIIMMFYDDIANNPQNPKKGTVINCPGCPNVYTADLPKDYTGALVTPENFLKILKGEPMTVGSGKTLKSGPNDKVFIYFTDHGSTGLIAFPSKYLYAADLISTLKFMYENKRYKELVFYIEACESGSMFNNLLPSNWNIYATTASNPFESSYACYYDAGYRAYLDDCYSIAFINDTQNHNPWQETLQQQYLTIKQITTQSHVCQYGDNSISKEVVGEFQAHKGFSTNKLNLPPLKKGDAVRSRDVKRVVLERTLADPTLSSEERATVEKQLAESKALKARGDLIWGSFAYNLKITEKVGLKFSNDVDHCYSRLTPDVECIKQSVELVTQHCGHFSEETIEHASKVSDACHAGYTPEQIAESMKQICSLVLPVA